MNPSLAENISWPEAPPKLLLQAGGVHVFAAPLDISSEDLSKLALSLSPDEVERAARFKFERHRNRYQAGRGWLRNVLARFLATDPAALRFSYSAHGKPVLATASNEGIHFNLAHSDDLALLAVTRVGTIGVDVERIRIVKEVDELVARFFSPRESADFQKLSASQKPSAFFNLWTRKEAMLKATGEGITGGLNRVEVSFLDGEPARVLAIGGDAAKASEWKLCNLLPAEGFVGAVAAQAANMIVNTWKLTQA